MSNPKKIPFSPPYIDEEVERQVLESLRSGWITTGPKVRALEGEIASLAGLEHALCVNSATSGMMLALHWYGVGPGDEVIIPVYTYVATALVVQHLGATPVMVDIRDDFNINPQKIREAITPKTKAIVPVDFGGWPCDYDAIREIVEEEKGKFQPANDTQEKLGRILLMADAAHSIGAAYKGKPSGSQADLTVFSLHAVKNVTSAEGGAICMNMPEPFDNAEIYATMRLWSLNGQTKDAFTKSQGGSWRYDIVYPGFKINMPDVCAAIALAQIGKYKDELWPERRKIFDLYTSLFENEEWADLPPGKEGNTESSYHLFALRIKPRNSELRDRVIHLAAEDGIALNVHFIPLAELSIFKEKGFKLSDFPMAKDQFEGVITLPIYPQLEEEDCRRIFTTIKQVVTEYQDVAIN
ncbi:MAG TPA: capsular biosynthesis protein [Cryomorphaceae bacterium]|nr:capsular biosynthesis protein [Owenweeksia sp.]HAD97314.1 capsular biosynthesis protein [Cryomorphaceae bacterium]HBF20171.1 capsular biosynthesis protein [Cryomorphaceae bacterium]HCQ15948.1 capsular biosynthesis protein [Cryomorphaceae bacterium]